MLGKTVGINNKDSWCEVVIILMDTLTRFNVRKKIDFFKPMPRQEITHKYEGRSNSSRLDIETVQIQQMETSNTFILF